MNRVLVLAEGQTEEVVLGRVLQGHLWRHGVHLVPTIVTTKKVVAGPNHKGGVSSWGKIERDLRLLCRDSNVVAITTFLDYYGLPSDVPGRASTTPSAAPRDQVRQVQASIDESVKDPRFRSYLALHEFEALLYTDPEACGGYLESPALAEAMTGAVSKCGEPEFVNDDPATAPSARIKAAFPTYQKTFHGPALVERIGLGALRQACPHFGSWVTWLESLGSQRSAAGQP
jgi:hypothetical protein